MKRLLEIGFEEVGNWSINGKRIKYSLRSHQKSEDLLYSFVVGNKVKYIGKTVNRLSKRMNEYQNADHSQKTNVRIKKIIKENLEKAKVVRIYVLVATKLLKYGKYKISVAAGLEDSLIKVIHPEWNFLGKKRPQSK